MKVFAANARSVPTRRYDSGEVAGAATELKPRTKTPEVYVPAVAPTRNVFPVTLMTQFVPCSEAAGRSTASKATAAPVVLPVTVLLDSSNSESTNAPPIRTACDCPMAAVTVDPRSTKAADAVKDDAESIISCVIVDVRSCSRAHRDTRCDDETAPSLLAWKLICAPSSSDPRRATFGGVPPVVSGAIPITSSEAPAPNTTLRLNVPETLASMM